MPFSITCQISATLQLLLFFFIAIFAFHPIDYTPEGGLSIFHMPVLMLMLMLITLLNRGTLITIVYDNAEASLTPNKRNKVVLFITSTILGMVSCVSSLLLLWFLLTSYEPSGFFHKLGISGVDYGQISTAVYLKVLVSYFLTLFSARTGPLFFWQIRPATILLCGGIIVLTVSSLLSIFWPLSEPDGILTEGLQSNMPVFGFLYCIFFWFLQDLAKVAAYKYIFITYSR